MHAKNLNRSLVYLLTIFNNMFYLTNRFHFCVRLYCNRITDDEEEKRYARDAVECVTFCSSHAMASFVIYYSTEAQKKKKFICFILS